MTRIPMFDKWIHIGMFSILVTLFAWGVYRMQVPRKKFITACIVIAIGSLLYGIAMEFVQKYFVVNRSFDLGDIAADAVGCLLGGVFSSKWFTKK